MSVFAQREAEEFIASGKKEFRYNREIQVTPGAKDVLSDAGVRLVFDAGVAAPAVVIGASSPVVVKKVVGAVADTSGYKSEDLALFNSPDAARVKEEICDIGRRIWAREYCDGNGGNISCRIGPDRFICTPTGVSKGFMTPDMICMVDGKGVQLAGTWKRSSEITTHLAIYHSTSEAVSVCHAHPCHAGAFAIKELEPPPRLIPELEVFVGRVVVAGYQTPGSPEIADSIRPLAPTHQSIIMGCHGVICWGKSVEDAYFKMEITDAYCRTVILAQALPGTASIPCEKMDDLLKIKKSMGLPDDRYDLKPAQLCERDPWSMMQDRPKACSTQADCGCPTGGAATEATNAELETLVQKMTDEIMSKLEKETK